MSPAQEATLRAVARGEVTIADGKPRLRRDDLRVTISTVRALEGRGLLAREDTPLWFHDERVHLTEAGRRDLAASFARPRPTGLTTSSPAPPPPKAAASRAR
ncbi:hypothetical protein [Streptomyces caeruleatus]|uniref:hypothetical protein n=1 Tax=Streptomyces caeruleatus TaxID=661399 RepID=UPI000A65CB8F|nr:hypothetical protein [Streptomyces caeruleatus]